MKIIDELGQKLWVTCTLLIPILVSPLKWNFRVLEVHE